MINKLLFKRILSLVRKDDYAHPGEEEAIFLALDFISKNPNRLVLDVGCGLGKTAKFVQDQEWGKVTGIDLNKEIIDYARKKYPEVKFYNCDIVNASDVLKNKYELFYLFNSFYSFPDQISALKAMRKIADKNASLVIFDYVNYGDYKDTLCEKGMPPILPCPIDLFGFEKALNKTEWRLIQVKNIDKDYERWYAELVYNIDKSKEKIEEFVGADGFDYFRSIFSGILKEVKRSSLGGAIVYAKAKAS